MCGPRGQLAQSRAVVMEYKVGVAAWSRKQPTTDNNAQLLQIRELVVRTCVPLIALSALGAHGALALLVAVPAPFSVNAR